MSESGFDQDVIVIGAGAAGLFAATEAALGGARTLLLEKNRKPGVKILASGGTRCNVTSTLPRREVGELFGRRAERFLRFGLHVIGPDEVRALLAAEGVATREHPMEKVFPESGRARDVLTAFLARFDRSGARLRTDAPVRGLARRDDGTWEVIVPDGRLTARRVIVTSGGRSYPKTGCTGEGYDWLRRLGHTIVATRPGLVPLVVERSWVRALTGVAVADAVVHALDARGKRLLTRRRPVLFTHRGLSGPGPMDVSRYVNANDGTRLVIDWLPDVSADELEARLLAGHRTPQRVQSFIPRDLQRRLGEALVEAAGVVRDRRLAELRRDERRALVQVLKQCEIPVAGDEGFHKAEVTAGGVRLDEIDPRTMESRVVAGLHVAGEILDVDGPIGGFNFQAAFSTGTVAGRAAARAVSAS